MQPVWDGTRRQWAVAGGRDRWAAGAAKDTPDNRRLQGKTDGTLPDGGARERGAQEAWHRLGASDFREARENRPRSPGVPADKAAHKKWGEGKEFACQ